jgi:DNA invertase Pin-like site-specific DNA recombinase
MKNAVAYYRVSTEEQEESRLGLEAQEYAVRQFAEREGYIITEQYTEVASGKKDKRPQLIAALGQCKKQRATLIVAKLDRLGRRVSSIVNLMDSKVDFRAVDNPSANKTMIQMLAVFAEFERDQISQRTKDGLAAAKRNGKILGQHGREVLSKQNAAAADAFAEKTRPIIEAIRSEGFKSIRSVMNELNRRNVPTFRKDGRWHYPTVYAMLKRIKENEKADV